MLEASKHFRNLYKPRQNVFCPFGAASNNLLDYYDLTLYKKIAYLSRCKCSDKKQKLILLNILKFIWTHI